MSEPLRIALVAEGPTDKVVIKAALSNILGDRPFILTLLQPEGDVAFGPLGGGWGGVYSWCHQSVARGKGRISGDALLFAGYDLLIIHIDADVAGKSYADANITPLATDAPLPQVFHCPPPQPVIDIMRGVLLSWLNEKAFPSTVVPCIPTMATEAWLLLALFPTDREVRLGIECYAVPENRLGQQPVRSRIRKRVSDYQDHAARIEERWHAVSSALTAARCFEDEVRCKIP